MRLPKLVLPWRLRTLAVLALPALSALSALTTLSALAEEPAPKSISMPAREQYRKPYDEERHSEFQRLVKITVSPAKFPHPLLKYRLNVYATELESGNAAPLYAEACAEYEKTYLQAEKTWYASNEYFDLKKSGASQEKIVGELFHAVPLEPAWPYDSFPKGVSPAEEAKFYQSLAPVYRLLEKASRMQSADWHYSQEHKGAIDVSLDRANRTRSLARYLSGKADWEIRNGKYDDAVKTLRAGIALSNHVENANSPLLIDMLVGIAIRGIMQQRIMTLASQPDAPNLYPALTQIPPPAALFQSALQGEQLFAFGWHNGSPVFEDVDASSPDECRARLENVAALFLQGQENPSTSSVDRRQVAAAMTMICGLCYPQGRDRLLAEGRTRAEIEKMTVYQVVAPYVFEEIKSAYDRLLVTATFPAGSSHMAIAVEQRRMQTIQSPLDTYLVLLLPAMDAAKRAIVRQQQTHELLKIIEAIRYYAAVHDGRPPESLAAIKEVPVATVDPMTGQPFGYKVDGRTVIIDCTWVGKVRLEITVQGITAQSKAGKP
jgi:hypothetical protein